MNIVKRNLNQKNLDRLSYLTLWKNHYPKIQGAISRLLKYDNSCQCVRQFIRVESSPKHQIHLKSKSLKRYWS